ncbi:hypothetical protein [Sphingobacterium corticibacter]|uniref:Uncharacterized protein n=1 Tax=Sphingobacterium corticibacter TaxID=2171749 RepID=A0A2T8HM20_9SPHI|nr:hypothetical protein [Sphingobacterium corticibacter]PVH26481.1 hypothetical protein DC487_02360 [Sphingobacterium corticibacter]
MRKSIFSFFNLTCLLLLTGLFVSCKDFNDLSTLIQEEDSSLFLKDDLRATSSFTDCLESYDLWTINVVKYKCPINAFQIAQNKEYIKVDENVRKAMEDSIGKYPGPIWSPEEFERRLQQMLDQKEKKIPLYPIYRYGVPINSIYDELANSPDVADVTIYVLDQVNFDGYIALGIRSNSLSPEPYSRAVAFYPNASMISTGNQYPERFFDVSGLAYTHSFTIEGAFIPELLNYVAHRQGSPQHFFSNPSFQGYQLFKEGFSRGSLIFPPTPIFSQSRWQTNILASGIRDWNPPAWVKVNLNGGHIPQRVGEGGGDIIFP